MRKIALTAILAMDPDIIILDEPTAGLDPQSRKQIMEKLSIYSNKNKTIIFTTRNTDVARYVEEIKIMR